MRPPPAVTQRRSISSPPPPPPPPALPAHGGVGGGGALDGAIPVLPSEGTDADVLASLTQGPGGPGGEPASTVDHVLKKLAMLSEAVRLKRGHLQPDAQSGGAMDIAGPAASSDAVGGRAGQRGPSGSVGSEAIGLGGGGDDADDEIANITGAMADAPAFTSSHAVASVGGGATHRSGQYAVAPGLSMELGAPEGVGSEVSQAARVE